MTTQVISYDQLIKEAYPKTKAECIRKAKGLVRKFEGDSDTMQMIVHLLDYAQYEAEEEERGNQPRPWLDKDGKSVTERLTKYYKRIYKW